MGLCKFCNKWINQPEGKRKKEFCNNTCRSNFWYGKNKKSKIVFMKPDEKAFEAPKTADCFKHDEVGQTNDPVFLDAADTAKLMRRLWDEKLELIAEDYPDWLKRVDSAPILKKFKELLKTTQQ